MQDDLWVSEQNDEELLPLKFPESLSTMFSPFLFVNVLFECCPQTITYLEQFCNLAKHYLFLQHY